MRHIGVPFGCNVVILSGSTTTIPAGLSFESYKTRLLSLAVAFWQDSGFASSWHCRGRRHPLSACISIRLHNGPNHVLTGFEVALVGVPRQLCKQKCQDRVCFPRGSIRLRLPEQSTQFHEYRNLFMMAVAEQARPKLQPCSLVPRPDRNLQAGPYEGFGRRPERCRIKGLESVLTTAGRSRSV